ncbi:hypothetical protein AAKU58_000583 [Oxalobacteraceae bacterium GrIS 1.18]
MTTPNYLTDRQYKDIDFVFIDDDDCFLTGIRVMAKGKKIATYSDPDDFLDELMQFRPETHIFIDNQFANYPQDGAQILKELAMLRFPHLYLLSGRTVSPMLLPRGAQIIYKSELKELKAIIKGTNKKK